MAKREETVAEREWHDFKAELLGRPHESLDLFDIERSIQHRLSAMGRELMAAAMKRANSDAPEVLSSRFEALHRELGATYAKCVRDAA